MHFKRTNEDFFFFTYWLDPLDKFKKRQLMKVFTQHFVRIGILLCNIEWSHTQSVLGNFT